MAEQYIAISGKDSVAVRVNSNVLWLHAPALRSAITRGQVQLVYPSCTAHEISMVVQIMTGTITKWEDFDRIYQSPDLHIPGAYLLAGEWQCQQAVEVLTTRMVACPTSEHLMLLRIHDRNSYKAAATVVARRMLLTVFAQVDQNMLKSMTKTLMDSIDNPLHLANYLEG